jgi:hypothetical protein
MLAGRVLFWFVLASLLIGVGISILIVPVIRERAQSPYDVSPIDPQPVLEPYVERTVTIDARARKGWVYFDFSRGSVVTDAREDGRNWDIAFSRYRVQTNSGSTNPNGTAGAIRLGPTEPMQAPADGYEVDAWEGYQADQISISKVFRRWYRYNPLAAGLVPRDLWFVIRTADACYAKLQFLSYHCPKSLGGGHGCVTFRYGYRSDFSRELSP